MNSRFTFSWPFSEIVVERLGWVLVHSLWQLALVALLAGVAVRVCRRNSAAPRYFVLVVAMTVSVALPVATWLLQRDVAPHNLAERATQAASPEVDTLPSGPEDVSPAGGAPLLPSDVKSDASPRGVAAAAVVSKPPPQLPASVPASIAATVAWSEFTQKLLQPWLNWIVAGWILGVVVCSLRPLLGWYTLRRLRRVGVLPVSDDVRAALHRVSQRLGMRYAVRVMQSTVAQVPVVIGYIQPMILLPVSLLTSIPPAQLEAILAHELVHVRRHDFVVNLLQTLVETLFFYHPAVWWLSHQIRVEREHCCDDAVVLLLGNRVEYGRALLAIEELRGHSTLLAPGATDGSLISRLRRIVGAAPARAAVRLRDRWPVALVTLGLLLTIACGTFVSTGAQEQPPKQKSVLEPIAGEVVDAVTGKPIEGATVRFLFKTARGDTIADVGRTLAELVFRDVGKFTFELPDAVQNHPDSHIFVERTAEHPDYQSVAPAGQILSYVLKDDPNQARDFIRKISMQPGKVVTGRVLDVDGRPAKNVAITSGYHRSGWQSACEHKTTTDANGRYRLIVPGDRGRGRIYVIPEHAAAVSRAISTDYGEQPEFRLQRGTRLHGRVLDTLGKGVPGVVVRADGSDRVPWRFAITDADGNYSMPPCQYGNYVVELMDEGRVPDTQKKGVRLPAVYVPQAISLPKTATTERAVEFRPVETVRVTAKYTTSDGTPVVGSRLKLVGYVKGLPWFGTLQDIPNQPGKYEVQVPRGLEQVRIDQNHDCDSSGSYFLRFTRQSPDSSDRSGNWFTRLDQDDDSLQIQRLKAGKLQWSTTVDGKPHTRGNIRHWPEFADAEAARELGAGAVTGSGIQHLKDGGFSTELHPEIDVLLKFEDPGFKPWNETVRLKEGEERTIEIKLQANAAEPTPAGAANDDESKPVEAKVLNGLRTKLTLLTDKPAVGQPLKVKIELENVGAVERTHNTQRANPEQALKVIGPNGQPAEFINGPSQIQVGTAKIKPGETTTLFAEVDVASMFLLAKPGRYQIKLQGADQFDALENDPAQVHPIPTSDTVSLTLGDGTLNDIQATFVRVRDIAPKDWEMSTRGNSILGIPPDFKKGNSQRGVLHLQFQADLKTDEQKELNGAHYEYLGQTKLGHAYLALPEAAKTDWPKCVEQIRQQLPTNFAASTPPGTDPHVWGQELDGLRTRMIVLTEKPEVGQPLMVKIELQNTSAVERTYQSQRANPEYLVHVLGPDGQPAEFINGGSGIPVQQLPIKPGETVVLFDNVDVASMYLLAKPGRYQITLGGSGQYRPYPTSNTAVATLAGGMLNDIQATFVRIKSIAPKHWHISTRGLAISNITKGTRGGFHLFFSAEQQSKELKLGGNIPYEYLGPTRLGHAYLAVAPETKAEWPECVEKIRERLPPQETAVQAPVRKPAAPAFLLPDHINVMAVGFDRESKNLVTVSVYHDVKIRTWDIGEKKLKSEVKLDSELHGNRFLNGQLMLSEDRRRVISILEGQVGIWETATGKLVKMLNLPPELGPGNLRGLACTPDCTLVACGRTGGGISPDAQGVVWDVASGKVVQAVQHDGSIQIQSVALSADGKWLATGGQRAGTCVWEVSTGKRLYALPNDNPNHKHPDPEVTPEGGNQVLCLAFSPDGQQLALGDLLSVKLVEAKSGKLLHRLDAPFRFGRSGLVYSKDSQLLSRYGTDKFVMIWSAESGNLLSDLPAGSNSGSFSGDGRWFATGCSDEKQPVAVWQLRDGVAAVGAEGNPHPATNADAYVAVNGEIRGQLMDDASGRPVAGAVVQCGAINNDYAMKGGRPNSLTDAEGRYRLRVPAPGIYAVWLKKYEPDPSLIAVPDDGILVAAGTAAPSRMRLVRGRTLTGKVVDVDGKPRPNLNVHAYSEPRPESLGAMQSAKTAEDGTFKLLLPPGRAHLFASPDEQQGQDPFGDLLYDLYATHAVVDVPGSGDLKPLTLTTRKFELKFGSNEWLARTTPGTQIVRHTDALDVIGVVVDSRDQPIRGARVFESLGSTITTNEKGEFRIRIRQQMQPMQFYLYAFQPGFRVWFGKPTSGDELKIVLEPREAHGPRDGTGARIEPQRAPPKPLVPIVAATDAATKATDQAAGIRQWAAVLVDGATDTPLQGITVVARGHIVGEPEPQLLTLKSDALGRIEVPLRDGHGTTLEVRAAGWWAGNWPFVGYFPSTTKEKATMPGDPAVPVRITVWRGTHVTGTLLAPDGQPAGGIILNTGVYITNQEWKTRLGMSLTRNSYDHGEWPNWSVRIVTAADGTFETTVPPPEARSWVRIGTTQLGFGSIDTPGQNANDPRQAHLKYAPFEVELDGLRFPEYREVRGRLDFGTLKLDRGVVLRGRVLDAADRPLKGIVLMTSTKYGPYAGRRTVSDADGNFEFLPISPSGLTLSLDARFRDDKGEVNSRDVQAVFLPRDLTLPDTDKPVEITVKAVPHVTVEFEWVDRRKKKGPVAYYGEFTVTGRVPREGASPAWWRGETEKIERDGRELLLMKIPRAITKPTLNLPADSVVTASYEEGTTKSGPGQVDLGDISVNRRRIIYGDESKEPQRPGNEAPDEDPDVGQAQPPAEASFSKEILDKVAQLKPHSPRPTTLTVAQLIEKLREEGKRYLRLEYVSEETHARRASLPGSERGPSGSLSATRHYVRDGDRSYLKETRTYEPRPGAAADSNRMHREETVNGRWWNREWEFTADKRPQRHKDPVVLPAPRHPLGLHLLLYTAADNDSLPDTMTRQNVVTEIVGEESVGPEPCVKVRLKYGASIEMLLWLALNKNLLPIRREVYMQAGERSSLAYLTLATEFKEIAPGTWFIMNLCDLDTVKPPSTDPANTDPELKWNFSSVAKSVTADPQIDATLFDKLGKPPPYEPPPPDAPLRQGATTNPQKGLQFLAAYPKLHDLSLTMTVHQFEAMAESQKLKSSKTVEGDKVTYRIPLGDGHTVIVMFAGDKCRGIQRIRGEEAEVPAME